jgi:hypothetical protein
MNPYRRVVTWSLVAVSLCTAVAHADGKEDAVPAITSIEEETLYQEIERGFYSRLNVLAFGITQEPADPSSLNPDNTLGISRYQAVINPRVDLNLDFRRLELSVKERFLYVWERWEDGLPAGREDSTAQFYLNEWFARYRLLDDLFVSYGRENLQWGPSVLISSSNPFNPQNGRNNPRVEVPGLDYARAVWIPSSNWSASFIANTNPGRLFSANLFGLDQTSFVGPATNVEARQFLPSYALKVDFTGDGKYFSLIPSYREQTGFQAGFFGGWNVSDAWLLYGEGTGGEQRDFQVQAGTAYTFEEGETVNLEYYHNENGCLLDNIRDCFVQGQVNSRDVYFRQDYLMGQYSDTKIWGDFNVNLRWIHDLNDQSNQFIGIFEYEAGRNTLLYLIANGFTGSSQSEFGSLLKYSLFVGAGYTY